MDEEASIQDPKNYLRAKLIEKVYHNESALNAEVAKELENGGNERAALQRIAQRVRRREISNDETVTGRYLQTYRRSTLDGQQDRGFSTYLLGKDGVTTIHIDQQSDVSKPKDIEMSYKTFGTPHTWVGLKKIEDVLTGSTFLSANPGKTKVEKGSNDLPSLWNMSQPFDQISDELGVFRAYVAGITQVKRFGSDERLPIFDGGAAHLNAILVKQPDRNGNLPRNGGTFCELTSETQIRALLGDLFDEQSILTDEGFRLIQQSMTGTPVVAFGSGLTSKNERLDPTYREKMKSSKLQFRNGLGLIVPATAQ